MSDVQIDDKTLAELVKYARPIQRERGHSMWFANYEGNPILIAEVNGGFMYMNGESLKPNHTSTHSNSKVYQ